jgi:hypothetical protein
VTILPPDGGDTFVEYRRLILASIENLNASVAKLDLKIDALRQNDISDLKVQVAMLQVRASVFGGVAGAIGGAIVGVLAQRALGAR